MAKKKIEETKEIVEKNANSKKKDEKVVEVKIDNVEFEDFEDDADTAVSKEVITSNEDADEVIIPITKNCINCGEEFVVFPSEQKFYKSKGYDMPKRCPSCRAKKSSVISVKCVDCNKVFFVDGKEAEYYTKNNLNIPKRCKQCREFKKIRNSNK